LPPLAFIVFADNQNNVGTTVGMADGIQTDALSDTAYSTSKLRD
jgi:hypothetical protein